MKPVSATVLTFEPRGGDGTAIDSAYGSRVTSPAQGGFVYGSAGGFTPNVVIEYGPVTDDVHRWSGDYGDLQDVIYREAEGAGILTVTLRADPGFLVVLRRFDLAGWPNTDYTINGVQVLDGAGTVVFSQPDAAIRGASGSPRHTGFDFGPSPLVAQVLTMQIDSRNLGGGSDNIGIDNIEFSQQATAAGRFEVDLSCPASGRRGSTVSAVVTLRNGTDVARTVTRRAELVHAGELRVQGPRVVPMALAVPAGSALAPGVAAAEIPILLSARAGSFLSVGLRFFGHVGADPRRKLLATKGCVVEVLR